ncbi:hypothetical protein pb186bvf_013185 [Paramecium bursaria]
MGNLCGSTREHHFAEKREYKDMIVEAAFSDFNKILDAQCIVNISTDPQLLVQRLKQLQQHLIIVRDDTMREGKSDTVATNLDLIPQVELQIGVWFIQEFRPKILENTKFIAYLWIDNNINEQTLGKIYQELFIALSNKAIIDTVIPVQWVDQTSIPQSLHANILFETLFTWRNTDQREKCSFTVYHDIEKKAISLVDAFLGLYNSFNPMPVEPSQNIEDQEDVDEDQRKQKQA